MPADRLADRLPDALHQVRACSQATPCSCRAPAGAWRPRAIPLGRAGGLPGLGHQPGRGQAARGRSSSARTRRSSPGRGSPSGSTPSSRPSARRPGPLPQGAASRRHGSSSSGATSGANPPADLARVFFLQLSVVGSTMGTRDELSRAAASSASTTGLRPLDRLDVRPRRAPARLRAPGGGRHRSASSSSCRHRLPRHGGDVSRGRPLDPWALHTSSGSSSSSRASQVASRSTGISNSGFRSTNSRSRRRARRGSPAPRRDASSSSSMPRSVKYTRRPGSGESVVDERRCSVSCRWCDPTAGDDDAPRETRTSGRPMHARAAPAP